MASAFGVKGSVNGSAAGLDKNGRPTRGVEVEPGEEPPPAGLASRDVLDEVRLRMDRRGYHWD
jgi:hypothetical protein